MADFMIIIFTETNIKINLEKQELKYFSRLCFSNIILILEKFTKIFYNYLRLLNLSAKANNESAEDGFFNNCSIIILVIKSSVLSVLAAEAALVLAITID